MLFHNYKTTSDWRNVKSSKKKPMHVERYTGIGGLSSYGNNKVPKSLAVDFSDLLESSSNPAKSFSNLSLVRH